MSKHSVSEYYSDEQIIFISQARKEGLTWPEVQDSFNKKFNDNKNHDTLRVAHSKYGNMFDLSKDESTVKVLREVVSTKKRSSKVARENKLLAEYIEGKESLLERIELLCKSVKAKYTVPKAPKQDKRKKKMTIEVMLSDLHYGKQTDTFNLGVARKRMQQLNHTLLREIERNKKVYNVDRLILALIGDIIESSSMHGEESARGCEFGNSRQVQEAINSIFYDMILPAAKTGIKIDVPAVTGNHDRTSTSRTMHDPGEENVTYIIYKTLELLCKQTGLKNVTFHIPKVPYAVLDIYGNCAVWEHFDNAKANNRRALMALLSDRQTQVKRIIDFFRGGHYHEYTVYGRGKIIVNGSLPGPDSYANVKGYESHSDQTINFYVETTRRPTSFYRSFPVYLD